MSGQPVSLPFTHVLTLVNEVATLTAPGVNSVYVVNGSGQIDIDTSGNVVLTGINAQGAYQSGTNVGTISIVQQSPAPPPHGSYVGTSVAAAVPSLYSDGTVQNASGLFSVSGAIFQGGSNVMLANDYPFSPQGDWHVWVTWSKATC
jgi:hypothetical protein